MSLKNLQNKEYWLGLFAVLAMAYIALFDSLGSVPIILWDESRLAINALEMYKSGNWLYLTYDGVADHFNAKPPMLIWLQVISLKIFGLNEFAIRFPSAIAGLLTCILIYWLLGKKYDRPLLGVIACAVLLTSFGYVKIHGVRTGDFDALLSFFMLVYGTFYYLYLEEEKKKYLYISFIAIIFSVLTKGIAGMIMLPAMLLYTLYKRKALLILRSPQFYIGLVSFLVVVIGYYWLRDTYDKNYITDMLDNEITGRYWRKDHMANYNKWYYYDLLRSKNFKWWYSFLFVGLGLGIFAERRKWSNLTIFATLFGLVQILFISYSESKTEWYDMPSYQFFVIVVAIGIYVLYQFIYNTLPIGKYRNVLPPILLLLLFIKPSNEIYKSIHDENIPFTKEEHVNMGYYMKGILRDKSINTHKHTIVNLDYCADILFYVKALQYTGRSMDIVRIDNFQPSEDAIIVFEDAVKQQIESTFTFEKIDNFRNVTLYRLYGKK